MVGTLVFVVVGFGVWVGVRVGLGVDVSAAESSEVAVGWVTKVTSVALVTRLISVAVGGGASWVGAVSVLQAVNNRIKVMTNKYAVFIDNP